MNAPSAVTAIKPADCRYAAFYCEENIWWLAQREDLPPGERFVVFISNPTQTCALWSQKLAAPGDAVVWDYHVVLVIRGDKQSCVFDFDSRVDFPADFEQYMQATFRATERLSTELRPWFRVVSAEGFVGHFSSDRSHMAQGGSFRAPAPPWPPIQVPGQSPNSLLRFLDVQTAFLGDVLPREQFEALFS